MTKAWRSATLAALALALALAACRPNDTTRRSPPNIIVIVIDCLRADRYGGSLPFDRYGGSITPNLDSLVNEGVRFTNAFAQTSWTRPSLPTLFTGLYPSEHGLSEIASASNKSLHPEAETLAEVLKEAGYSTKLLGHQHLLAPRFGMDQGFDVYEHKLNVPGRWLLRWIRDDMEAPFFAYLHHLDLHWPYCPPPDFRGTLVPEDPELDFCSGWRRLRLDLHYGRRALDEDGLTLMQARYDEQLLYIDSLLGNLFQFLRRKDLWDETLVVLTSDHGEEFFEHGSIGHGKHLHDETIRIPMVIKPPASWKPAVGREVQQLVELRQLAPTLLDAANVGISVDQQNQSLLPSLLGQKQETERTFVVSELGPFISIRTDRLKLILKQGTPERSLYDLVEDPGEKHNVAAERNSDVKRLESLYREWRDHLKPIETQSTELDSETLEGLKALGYLD
jgi:arylsulfatase A-like enzyme